MTTGRTVEVEGIFWKEREANGHRLLNNVEAQRVTFYPPLTPDQAAHPSPLLTSPRATSSPRFAPETERSQLRLLQP